MTHQATVRDRPPLDHALVVRGSMFLASVAAWLLLCWLALPPIEGIYRDSGMRLPAATEFAITMARAARDPIGAWLSLALLTTMPLGIWFIRGPRARPIARCCGWLTLALALLSLPAACVLALPLLGAMERMA